MSAVATTLCTRSISRRARSSGACETQDMMTATPALYRDTGAVRGLQRHRAGSRCERWQSALDLRREAARRRRSRRGCRPRLRRQPHLRLDRTRCCERQRAVEALLLVLVDRVAAGRARRRRLHRLIGRRRCIRNRCTRRQAALEGSGPGLGLAAHRSRRQARCRGNRRGGRLSRRARRLARRHRSRKRRDPLAVPRAAERRRRWRRRRNGASRPRPRWRTASSMQRTCRAASTRSSASAKPAAADCGTMPLPRSAGQSSGQSHSGSATLGRARHLRRHHRHQPDRPVRLAETHRAQPVPSVLADCAARNTPPSS